MTLKSLLLAGLLFTLSACAVPPERPVIRAAQADISASALLNELSRIAGLSGEQRRSELAELDASRLDDSRRFQMAALLERDDSVEALERSLKNLTALGDLDTRSQALVELMKKSLKARIEQKQLTARNAELQDRLEQIKTLEKSLQQRSVPHKNP